MMSTKDRAGTPQHAVGGQPPDATPQRDLSLYERLIDDGVAIADARGGAIDHLTARRPAVALVGSYELLMKVIRGSQVPADGASGTGHDADPLQERAAELFAGELAGDRVPSVRAIRAQLHVGQARAQRLRDYLATGAARRVESPAA